MDDVSSVLRILPVLLPLVVVELALMVIALIDVIRRERVRGGNKVVWIIVVVAVGVIGPIIYLLFGREENRVDSD